MDAVYTTRNTVFSAATGARTVLKIITGTTFGLKVHEIGVSMDGVTSTAVPATFEWGTSDETTAGTSHQCDFAIEVEQIRRSVHRSSTSGNRDREADCNR